VDHGGAAIDAAQKNGARGDPAHSFRCRPCCGWGRCPSSSTSRPSPSPRGSCAVGLLQQLPGISDGRTGACRSGRAGPTPAGRGWREHALLFRPWHRARRPDHTPRSASTHARVALGPVATRLGLQGCQAIRSMLRAETGAVEIPSRAAVIAASQPAWRRRTTISSKDFGGLDAEAIASSSAPDRLGLQGGGRSRDLQWPPIPAHKVSRARNARLGVDGWQRMVAGPITQRPSQWWGKTAGQVIEPRY